MDSSTQLYVCPFYSHEHNISGAPGGNLSSQERRMMYWLEIGIKAKATVTLHILGRNSRIHTMSYCDDTQKVQGEHHHDIKMFYRNYFPTIIQHHNSGTKGGFVIMFHFWSDTDLVDAHLGRPISSCAAGMKMCVMRPHFRIPHEHKVYFRVWHVCFALANSHTIRSSSPPQAHWLGRKWASGDCDWIIVWWSSLTVFWTPL